jgi:fucose 4-O-acetylase-like acetyltransferase
MYVSNQGNTQVPATATSRLEWVDVVRGLGIILMFYGHYIQKGISPDNASAVEQFRFIYSFHMPMFFIISGFFFRPATHLLSRIHLLALRRLLPVLFFTLLLFPLWFRDEIMHHASLWQDMGSMAVEYFIGRPELDWVTWFLVCLFVCECMALVMINKLRGWVQLTLTALFCLALGLVFCEYSITSSDGWLYTLGRSWFLSEAVVALGFYMIGYASFPLLMKQAQYPRFSAMVFIIAIGLVFLTYSLNHPDSVAVMMAARKHGNAFYFVITALAGSLAIISLGMFIQGNGILQMLGRNSLPLLGLNGLFFHYVDPKLSHLIVPANNEFSVTLDALLITTLSLLVCLPAVYLLNRYLPQLIGTIHVSGPWLPALDGRHHVGNVHIKNTR